MLCLCFNTIMDALNDDGMLFVPCASSVNIWCLHSKDQICNTIFMKLGQNFVLKIARPSSNMGHVGSKAKSPGQILGNLFTL